MSIRLVWPAASVRGGSAQRILLRRGLWVIGVIILAAMAWGPAAMIGRSVLTAGAAAAQQAADMIAERSPGLRTRAEMSKGKPRLALDRVSRALPRIRNARPAAPAPAAAPIGAAPLGALPPPVAAPAIFVPAAPVGGAVFAESWPGFGLFPPPPGFGIGGGGGGGGIVVTPPAETTPEIPPVAPPPPIPEPAAWMTMILGFAGIGAMVRHRRRVLAHG